MGEKSGLKRRFFRLLAILFGLAMLVGIGGALLVIWKPKIAVVYAINYLAPQTRFSADTVHWGSSNSLVMENARFGHILKIPRITLRWEWQNLWHRRLEEIRMERAEVFMDLKELAGLGGIKSSGSATTATGGQPWHLGKLRVERSGLVVVGLAPTVPPLTLEWEGELLDVPLGSSLSEADLQKKRKIELRQIHIHSPLDLATTLLKMESITLEFRLAGLRSRKLDSLVFNRPILDVDRGFFWFVEELRKNQANRSLAASSPGSSWRVRNFQIREGRLDITRLQEISVQYPFNFEVTRQDLDLRDLSLAQFQIELDIPPQDLTWDAMEMSFKNLHGKIAFHLSESHAHAEDGLIQARPANDVVNTLYVDTIRWRQVELGCAWLSLTFDPNQINGMFGGSFASGYINGGVMCGWSGKDIWQLWGSAADVDAGEVSDAFSNETFAMNGRADLQFELKGKMDALGGNLKLNSLSEGTIEIYSMDRVLERIRKNTEGLKREFMHVFVNGLKNYPYRHYALEIDYSKPDAVLKFVSEGELGSRRLDLHWHGSDNVE